MSKRTKIFIALGIILAIVVAFFIILVSMNSEVVPDIYAFSNSNNKAMAIRMGYKWNSFNGEIIADGEPEYVITDDNLMRVFHTHAYTYNDSYFNKRQMIPYSIDIKARKA